MTETAWIGVAILICVSLVVRISPSLLRPPLSQATMERIELVLPIAVLINLGVFSASSEIAAAPSPALLGFAILGVLTLAFRRIPVVMILFLSTVAFVSLL